MKRLPWSFSALALSGFFTLALSPAAFAQGTPKSAAEDAKATTGETSVTSDKAATVDAKAMKEGKDATELSLSAGTLNATGNARLVAATAAGKFRHRRGENQFSAAAAGNYARAGAPGTPVEVTVENMQGLARFDRFLGDVALFLQTQARRDRFQGLELRLNVDPGVGYYFVNEKTTLFWVEGGYDLGLDVRRDDSRGVVDAKKNPVLGPDGRQLRLAETQLVHSARLFVGYEQAFETGAKVSAGIEYLQGLAASNLQAGTKATDIYRINGVANAQAKLFNSFSLAFGFTARFDNAALPGKEKLDTLTSASLVYTVL
jgi:hypothetical protein